MPQSNRSATLYRALTVRAPPEATDRLIDDELRPVSESIPNPTRYRAGFLAAVDGALRLRQSERPQTVADRSAKLLGGIPPLPSVGEPDRLVGRLGCMRTAIAAWQKLVEIYDTERVLLRHKVRIVRDSRVDPRG